MYVYVCINMLDGVNISGYRQRPCDMRQRGTAADRDWSAGCSAVAVILLLQLLL